MSSTAQQILRAANKLKPDARIKLARELIKTAEADDKTLVRAAWVQEVRERAERALAGESSSEPWDVVYKRLQTRAWRKR